VEIPPVPSTTCQQAAHPCSKWQESTVDLCLLVSGICVYTLTSKKSASSDANVTSIDNSDASCTKIDTFMIHLNTVQSSRVTSSDVFGSDCKEVNFPANGQCRETLRLVHIRSAEQGCTIWQEQSIGHDPAGCHILASPYQGSDRKVQQVGSICCRGARAGIFGAGATDHQDSRVVAR